MTNDRFKHMLIADRIYELGVICRTQFDHKAWRVMEEVDFAAAALRGGNLDMAEVHCEKAEDKLIAERCRVLVRRRLCDFIGQWQMHIPRGIHPSARAWIEEYLTKMRSIADHGFAGEIAPHEVESALAGLAAKIRNCVVEELRWEAEKAASVGYHKDAHRLRRQADRFEVTHYGQHHSLAVKSDRLH